MRKLIFLTLLFLSSTVFAEPRNIYIVNQTDEKITITYGICIYNINIIPDCNNKHLLNINRNSAEKIILPENSKTIAIKNIEYNKYNFDLTKYSNAIHIDGLEQYSDATITITSNGLFYSSTWYQCFLLFN